MNRRRRSIRTRLANILVSEGRHLDDILATESDEWFTVRGVGDIVAEYLRYLKRNKRGRDSFRRFMESADYAATGRMKDAMMEIGLPGGGSDWDRFRAYQTEMAGRRRAKSRLPPGSIDDTPR